MFLLFLVDIQRFPTSKTGTFLAHFLGSTHPKRTQVPPLNLAFHDLFTESKFVCLQGNAADLSFLRALKFAFAYKLAYATNKSAHGFPPLSLYVVKTYERGNTTVGLRVKISTKYENFVRNRRNLTLLWAFS